jgi:hypothetical protein
MPSLRFNQPGLTAGQVIPNLLTGSKFEFLPVDAAIIVYGVSDTPGVQVEVTFGNVIECDQMELPVLANNAASGAGPNTNDHRLAAGAARAGDRLAVRIFNSGATQTAPAGARVLVEIRPL